MNQARDQTEAMDKPARNRPVGRKSVGSIAVIVAVSLYAFAQPHLNEQFGWNLPGLTQTHEGKVAEQETNTDFDRPASVARPSLPDSASSAPSASVGVKTSDRVADAKPTTTSPKKSGPLSGRVQAAPQRDQASSDRITDQRMKPSGSTPGMAGNKAPPTADPTADPKAADGDELVYGLLREIRTDRYLSPQGLQYVPGSAEGHRLEHLRRHTEDQPSRPGKHGVFDGGMEGALVTIDDAYQRAKKNQRTTKQVDRDRTIYTVDMGRRIGYVGGRDGNRQRKPMARRVKMVLEGTQVITAYPL